MFLLLALLAPSAVVSELRSLTIDPAQTYRVRELEIARGDIKLYLSEGILAFSKPVAGKTIAAVFTTANTEAGDAEVLLLPPTRSERAALASFVRTPNLDEHLQSAVMFFTDDTANELQTQLHDHPLHPAPEQAAELAASADNLLRAGANEIDVKLVRALLDDHPVERGFFYGILGGRSLGYFNVVYEPDRFEPIAIGRIASMDGGGQYFQIWSSFRPRRSKKLDSSTKRISDYHLDTVIHGDLSMSAQARFQYQAAPGDGRTISLELSSYLRITAAKIDGQPAEFFQHAVQGDRRSSGAALFLLAADQPLAAESTHEVEVSYEGTVVRRTDSGNYFVEERNSWYPFLSPFLSAFDLIFHCPAALRVAASGELISDEVSGGVRTVHRKTQGVEPLVGFNLGEFETSSVDHGRYRIELFTNETVHSAELPAQAASILDNYTNRWLPLNIHSLAISPIEGYFGQGFPGLIYLSTISYMKQEDRPAALRNPLLDSFFTEMLLPHEVAHQWWGSMASQADYRTAWLFEAMSNYSALEYLEQTKGRPAMDAVLERYRQDLLAVNKGRAVESAGPVDFGERLLDNNGMWAWHVIVYEKGAWILHMLRLRLGDEAFHTLQTRLLTDFQNKLIANEDFRRLAAGLQPAGLSDKSLAVFFDNWVYSTGIPRMTLHATGSSVSLKVSGVEDAFAFDLPLRCTTPNGKEQTEWVHVGAGDNSYEMSDGSTACQLPQQADYLFAPGN